jgi:hypothetical protein
MLCHICQGIFTGPTPFNLRASDLPSSQLDYSVHWKPHCKTPDDLHLSVQSSCFICAQIWEGHCSRTQESNAEIEAHTREGSTRLSTSASYYVLILLEGVTHLQFGLRGSKIYWSFYLRETKGRPIDNCPHNLSADLTRFGV